MAVYNIQPPAARLRVTRPLALTPPAEHGVKQMVGRGGVVNAAVIPNNNGRQITYRVSVGGGGNTTGQGQVFPTGTG